MHELQSGSSAAEVTAVGAQASVAALQVGLRGGCWLGAAGLRCDARPCLHGTTHALPPHAVPCPPTPVLQMDLDMAQEALQAREAELEDVKVRRAGRRRWHACSAAACWPGASHPPLIPPALPSLHACPRVQLALEMKDEAIEALRQWEARCRDLEAAAATTDAQIHALEARLQARGLRRT